MDARDQELIFSALMTGRLFVEDALGIDAAGLDSGFKPGVLRDHLDEINRALTIIGAQNLVGSSQSQEATS